MIVIVDYGMGNNGSLLNMLWHIGAEAKVSSDPDDIVNSSSLILPGVGAFAPAIKRISEINGLREALDYKVMVNRSPILGICLGMQLLTSASEEGNEQGLGWIDATTKKLPRVDGVKIPHMGWNNVYPENESLLFSGLLHEARFYFVHSYYVSPNNSDNSLMKTRHGVEFTSAIGSDNIFGVQFHPEKSHSFGMRLLHNFAQIS